MQPTTPQAAVAAALSSLAHAAELITPAVGQPTVVWEGTVHNRRGLTKAARIVARVAPGQTPETLDQLPVAAFTVEYVGRNAMGEPTWFHAGRPSRLMLALLVDAVQWHPDFGSEFAEAGKAVTA